MFDEWICKKKNRQAWPVVSAAFSSESDLESSPDPRPDPDSEEGSDSELSISYPWFCHRSEEWWCSWPFYYHFVCNRYH